MKQTPPERRGLSLFRGNFGDPYTQGALKPSAPSSSRCKTKRTEKEARKSIHPGWLSALPFSNAANRLRVLPAHCASALRACDHAAAVAIIAGVLHRFIYGCAAGIALLSPAYSVISLKTCKSGNRRSRTPGNTGNRCRPACLILF